MPTWIDDVIRCPAQFSNRSTNSSGGSSNISSFVFDESFASSHNLSMLVRTLRSVLDDDQHGDGDASQNVATDAFPYASTTLLYSILAVQSLVFCIWCAWRLRGLLVYAAPSSRQPRTDGTTAGTTPIEVRRGHYGSIFQPESAGQVGNSTFARLLSSFPRSRGGSVVSTPLVGGGPTTTADDSAPPVRVRIVTKSTNNNVWAFYFGSVVLLRVVATGTLVFAANYSKDNHREALRIAWLVQNLIHGLSCVWLAVALNVQRLYRVKDHKNAKANQALLRQATFINRFCFSTFVLFSVGDFITSHTVATTSDAAVALYWVSIGSLLLLAVPTVLSTMWVVLHESLMQPTRLAKAMLTAGVIMHTVVELPPSFWNDHVLSEYTQTTPCPLKYLSFYDMILVAQFFTACLLFWFVVLEHRRTTTIVHRDYLAFCEDRLYRRLAKDGSLQQRGAVKPTQQSKGRQGGDRSAVVKFRQASLTSTAQSMSTIPTPKHPRDDDVVVSEQLDDSLFYDDDAPYEEGSEFFSQPTMVESDFARMEDGALNEDVGDIGLF